MLKEVLAGGNCVTEPRYGERTRFGLGAIVLPNRRTKCIDREGADLDLSGESYDGIDLLDCVIDVDEGSLSCKMKKGVTPLLPP